MDEFMNLDCSFRVKKVSVYVSFANACYPLVKIRLFDLCNQYKEFILLSRLSLNILLLYMFLLVHWRCIIVIPVCIHLSISLQLLYRHFWLWTTCSSWKSKLWKRNYFYVAVLTELVNLHNKNLLIWTTDIQKWTKH